MSNSLFKRQLWCGVLVSSLGAVGCGPFGDPSPAASCADIKAEGYVMERDYVLYQNLDLARPYMAYCAEDGSTYLPLPSGGANNYSQKLNVSGHSITTRWERVRIDPATLAVDPTDFRFSTSTGSIPDWNASSVNYGSAGDCVGSKSNTGKAGVDLTGTPFAVTATWQSAGNEAIGSATKSSNNQIVSVSGGGYCGDMAVNGALTLSYVGYMSCEAVAASGGALDKEHTLYLGDDGLKPYTAYCPTGGGTYLTLPTGALNNFSQKVNVMGESVSTKWDRVRFDPKTVTIDVTDFRFSTSTGFVSKWNQSNVNYGSAGDCMGSKSTTGQAGVDLTGLPFVVTAKWNTVGYLPGGTATKSANDQIVSVTGGGFCGDMSVEGPMTLSYRKDLLK